MADDVTIQFGAQIDKLVEGVNAAKEHIESIKESADKVSETFRGWAEVLGIALSMEGLKEFIKSMAELGEKVESTSAILGTSAEETVQLMGIAKLTGTSFDGLAMSMERMNLNLQRSTRDGTNPTAQALKTLNINAKEFIATPLPERIDKLREAIAPYATSLNLTTAVQQVAGRAVAQMIPMLKLNEEAYNQLKEAQKKAQDGLAAAIPGMADTNTKLNLLSLAAQSFGARLFTVLKPAIDAVVGALTKWLQSMDSGTMRRIITTIGDVSLDVLSAVGHVVLQISDWMRKLADNADSLKSKLSAAAGGALGGLAGGAALGGPIGAGLGLIGGGAAGFLFGGAGKKSPAEESKDELEKFDATISGWRRSFHTLTLTVGGGGESGGGKAFPAINFGAKAQIDAQITAIDIQIEAWKSYYEKLEVFDKNAVDTFKITEGQKVADLLKALDQRESATKALYNQEIALVGGNAAEVMKIRKKLAAVLDDIDKKRITNEADQLKKATQEWQSFGDTIVGAWNSQLRGLLAGTTSWAQAMKNITGDLIIKMIEEFEKLAVAKAASGLGTAFAGTILGGGPASALSGLFGGGGAAAATTANTGALATLTASITALTVAIGGETAATTAETAATTAETAAQSGSAITGAASAASGIVGAFKSLFGLFGIAGFEFGTDYVPRTGLAVLHQGEAVVPASQNAGGGLQATFNISAWDASSVQSWLRSGGGTVIARHVSAAMNANPTLRPGY